MENRTKAQEVRDRRAVKVYTAIAKETNQVFDWILDEFDKKTENEDYSNICVFLCNGELKIFDGTTYEGKLKMLEIRRIQFFNVLKERIEKEDGFEAIINLNDKIDYEETITITISMN